MFNNEWVKKKQGHNVSPCYSLIIITWNTYPEKDTVQDYHFSFETKKAKDEEIK